MSDSRRGDVQTSFQKHGKTKKKEKARVLRNPDLRVDKARARQKGVIEKMVGSGGKISVAEASRQEGYSEAYIHSGKLQKTKAFQTLKEDWNALLETTFPDERIVKHIDILLEAKKIDHYIFPKSESDESIRATIESFGFPVMKIKTQGSWKRAYFSLIDPKAKKDALEMILNLKQKYDNTFTANINVSTLTDAELDEIIAELGQQIINTKDGVGGKKKKKGE